jgi:hypothetical protein
MTIRTLLCSAINHHRLLENHQRGHGGFIFWNRHFGPIHIPPPQNGRERTTSPGFFEAVVGPDLGGCAGVDQVAYSAAYL